MCKKPVEWGRWKIILVNIINIKQIALEIWRMILKKIMCKKQVEWGRWKIMPSSYSLIKSK